MQTEPPMATAANLEFRKRHPSVDRPGITAKETADYLLSLWEQELRQPIPSQ